jgi:ketosteroid isomerase-like protein
MAENNTMKLFAEGLRFCMGDRLATEAVSFVDMLADDAIMEFPYALPGSVERLDGKAAIEKYMEEVSGRLQIERFAPPVIHPTPDGFVLETSCEGVATRTGKPYNQQYISVITLRDGHIAHYRDYWNPMVALEAMGAGRSTEQGGK